MSKKVEVFNANKLGGGENESYRRVPDPHYSEKSDHKARGEYHKRKPDNALTQLYLAWIDWLASLPKTKTFLEELQEKQEKKRV